MSSHMTNETSPEGTPSRTTRRKILKATSLALGAVAVTGTTASLASNPNPDSGKVANDDRLTANGPIVTPAVPPRGGGGGQMSYKMFCGADFKVRSSSTSYAYNQGGVISPSAANGEFQVKLELPQGARIIGADFFILDNDSTNDVDCYIFSFSPLTTSVAASFFLTTTGASTAFQTLSVSAVDASHPNGLVVDNYNYSYNLVVYTNGATNSLVKIQGARVAYHNVIEVAKQVIINPGN